MNKTIAAISTPAGKGGISIIRLSGKDSLKVAQTVFKSITYSKKTSQANENPFTPKPRLANLSTVDNEKPFIPKPRLAYLGIVETEQLSDQCLLIYFKAPKSYTGEDVVEFHTHGNSIIAYHILNQLIKNGARLAENGEFTKRALLNGKLSISQAESISEIINAQSEAQVRAGFENLGNHIHKEVTRVEELLYRALSFLEVSINYSEEDGETDLSEVPPLITKSHALLTALSNSQKSSKLIREGISLTIVGKPNVGKSSILNALVGKSRAIVTDIPGTTRDIIEDAFSLGGVLYNLKDTAGITDSSTDYIEQLGIARSIDSIKGSQLVIFAVDDTANEDDLKILQILKDNSSPQNIILISNKSDKVTGKINKTLAEIEAALETSAIKTNTVASSGITPLTSHLESLANKQIFAEGNVFINARQSEAITNALSLIGEIMPLAKKAQTMLKCIEQIAATLRQSLACLAKITGKNLDEALLAELFANFCLGK